MRWLLMLVTMLAVASGLALLTIRYADGERRRVASEEVDSRVAEALARARLAEVNAMQERLQSMQSSIATSPGAGQTVIVGSTQSGQTKPTIATLPANDPVLPRVGGASSTRNAVWRPTAPERSLVSASLAAPDLKALLDLTPAPRIDATSNLHDATLRFNKPTRMSRFEERVVEARIELPGAPAIQSLGDIGVVQGRAIQVGDVVKAELVSDDFAVTPIGSTDPMEITRESVAQWAWRIKPKKAGPARKLLLNVYSVQTAGGAVRLITNYAEVIPVRVSGVDRLILSRDWVVNNWGAFIGVLAGLAGVGGFLWKVGEWWGRRRRPA